MSEPSSDEVQRIDAARVRINYDRGGWLPPGGPHTFDDLLPDDQKLVTTDRWFTGGRAAILVVDNLPDGFDGTAEVELTYRLHVLRLAPSAQAAFVWSPGGSGPSWKLSGKWRLTTSVSGQNVILVLLDSNYDQYFGKLLQPTSDPYADKGNV